MGRRTKKEKTARVQADLKLFDYSCNPKARILLGKNSGTVGKGKRAEYYFVLRCEHQGLDWKFFGGKSPIDFKVNNKFLVDVKSSSKAHPASPATKVKYFHTNTSKKQNKKCHFFAFYIFPWGQFYIIPNMGQKGLSIPDRVTHYYNSGTGYREYKEAWHLLS